MSDQATPSPEIAAPDPAPDLASGRADGNTQGRQSPLPPRRRLAPLIMFFAVLGLVGYFVFTAVDGFVNAGALDTQVVALEQEIADLDWEAEQLSALVSFLDSDEYIERIAREELGLVRPGEEAFAVQAPIRPGLRVVRSPWWANLLPEPPTLLQ